MAGACDIPANLTQTEVSHADEPPIEEEPMAPHAIISYDDTTNDRDARYLEWLRSQFPASDEPAIEFLSQKTIEYHLSNVYRKLNVHSRAELGDLSVLTAAAS